jgi:transcriptional regulator GlxA family with amidase domain
MAQRATPPPRVADLARQVNLSESQLTRLFRAETGKAPWRYDRDARLERARELIVNSFKSIKEVMTAVGWNDPSHFCRDFKQRFGVSPRGLREAVRG